MKRNLLTIMLAFFVVLGVNAQKGVSKVENFAKKAKVYKRADGNHLNTYNTKGVIFSEDFEGGAIPADWTLISSAAAETWEVIDDGGTPPNNYLNCYYDFNQDEFVYTAAIDLGTDACILSFDWLMSYYWGVDPNDNYDLKVEISTDGGSSFTPIWTEADEGVFNSYEWYTSNIDLSAYSGNIQLGFRYIGDDGAQGDFDNIIISTPSTETDITAFSFAEQVGFAAIDATAHTVNINVPTGTDVTALVATFTLSDGATANIGGTAQVSGTTANDFSSAVTYNVVAEDGTTNQDWTVTVTAVSVYSVTFNCNINDSITSGYFVPGTDILSVMGDFAGWSAPGTYSNLFMTDDDSDGIYTLTMDFAVGNYAYKYFKNAGWDNGEWNGGDNRTFDVVDADVVLNDYFGDINNHAAINEISSDGIKVFPNPSNGVFNINVENNYNLDVFDITGRVINSRTLTGNTSIELNTSGVYFLRFSNEKGSFTQKVIVK